MDQRDTEFDTIPSSSPVQEDRTDRERLAERNTANDTPDDGPRSRLSFVIPSLNVGGAEQVTVSIVNGLAARDYDVELVVSRFEGRLKSELRTDVPVVALSESRTPVLGVAAEFRPIVAYLREQEPAALIPHLPRMSVVCLAAARLAATDTAVFPTHHSAYGHGRDDVIKSRTVDWLVRRLYPTADRVIAVSDGVANGISRLTAVDRADISVLHNPIEVDVVRERARQPVDGAWIDDDDTDVILFVGRLEDQKDLETWLRAFARIHDDHPDMRGVIAGKGSRREPLVELAADLGIGDVVAMPGYVDNPYGFMAEADLFMLSSRYEGLPTVMIEAMACGCPVVSTDAPHGPSEILEEGDLGRLVPVGDPGRLASAAVETLDDPPPEQRLRARANEFAPEEVLNDFERFIQEHVRTP
jgi:glycosyltransferase involved in cell wall biosynthesis